MFFRARVTYWQSGSKEAMADEVEKLKEKNASQRANKNKKDRMNRGFGIVSGKL